eukprot:Hpha_TRINITY_DN12564_c0_g1::TRINITY_DN12564_c0_g1_i1::g.50823::m.50823
MSGSPSNAQLAMGAAKNAVANVDWKAAGDTAKTKAQEAFVAVRRGDVSTQVLCFAGGIALLVHSILNIVNIFNSVAAPFQYVFNFYMAFFGLMTAVYEWPATCNAMGLEQKMKDFHNWCDIWFKVFSSLIGRGLVYVAFGILISSSSGLFSSTGLIGLYLIACGALLLFWSWKVRKAWSDKIKTLRDEKVNADSYKKDFSGAYGMTKPEFSNFMSKRLNMELQGEELNIAFRHMDSNDNGHVTFEEFKESFETADSYKTFP